MELLFYFFKLILFLVSAGLIFSFGCNEKKPLKENPVVKEEVKNEINYLEEAYKIARKIASHSPVAIALTRQMMYRNAAQDHPIEAHKVDSLAIYYASLKDGKEGVKSFLEKRAPDFKSKASEMPDFYPWWKQKHV